MSPYRAEEINGLLASSAPCVPAAPACELRRDLRQRDIVASAIAMLSQGHGSIMPAVEYLKAHAIRPHVIERVMLEPARRRMLA